MARDTARYPLRWSPQDSTTFTATGTFTVPAGCNMVYVTGVGCGGGGSAHLSAAGNGADGTAGIIILNY